MELANYYNQYEDQSYKTEQENVTKTETTFKGRKQKQPFPVFIEDFGQYLADKNYSASTTEAYMIRLRRAFRDLAEERDLTFTSINDFQYKGPEIINFFENLKYKQIRNKQLKPTSAHSDMKAIKLFFQYLFSKRIINYKYVIPKDLLSPATRSNLFVDDEDLLNLAMKIKTNKNPLGEKRSYALLLLYIDTGCRPIEASNVQITDISLTEKTISLFCNKSGTRKLELSNFVIWAFKEYIEQRKKLNPTNDYFFLRNDGQKTSTRDLSIILLQENIKAFGNSRINARALRHTYVTKAFENPNDLKDVSETMGHKHWVSTMHYLHRSKDRLLKNTLPYNPLPDFNSGGN
jgi:integrase/recombinase XerC